ncbi:MAG: sugar phosphate isomerase/epimerase [Chloroflexi bacterium]|nr:sugar phosphate isomerase/epimerase [Chloroflexota bacterium]
MRLSAHQTLLPGADLSERFQRAAECGLDGIELAFGRTARAYDLLAEIEAAMAASGLPVGSICGTYEGPIVHPDPAERGSRLADTLEFADEIGARGVIVVPIFSSTFMPEMSPPMPDMSPVADEDALITKLLLTMLAELLERAAGNAAVYLEPLNRYEATYLNTVGKAAELCSAADHPRIQFMADLFHMNIEEADIPASLRAVAPHLGHVHLADSQRRLPGHGHTDFVGAFRTLREIDFDGWLALECMPTPGDPLANMCASVAYLRGCWESAGNEPPPQT